MLTNSLKDFPEIQKIDELIFPKKSIKIYQFLGHSVLENLITCPRKYAIELPRIITKTKSQEVPIIFGNAVHAGIQTLWKTGKIELALIFALKNWNNLLTIQETKRSIWHVFHAILQYNKLYYIPLREQGFECFLIEPSGRIHFPENFQYGLHIDLILYNKQQDEFLIQELKTTGRRFHPALFANSRQSVGYTITFSVARKIPLYQIRTQYIVYTTSSQEFNTIDISVSTDDCIQFLTDILIHIKQLQLYNTQKYFPKYGLNCMKYNLPCKYFGECDSTDYLQNLSLDFPEAEFDFDISWNEILNTFNLGESNETI